jgi:hypothetical protein
VYIYIYIYTQELALALQEVTTEVEAIILINLCKYILTYLSIHLYNYPYICIHKYIYTIQEFLLVLQELAPEYIPIYIYIYVYTYKYTSIFKYSSM